MTQTKNAQVEMMKVDADIGQIAGLLRQLNITGPMRDYAEKRVGGGEIAPSLAASAHVQAKALLDDTNLRGLTDSSSGLSVGILTSFLKDVEAFAKIAASRMEITKLADKFEKALQK